MDTQHVRHWFGFTPTLGHTLLSRRRFLGAGLAAAGAGLVAACAPAPAAAPSATAPAGSAAPASAPARPAQPTGELKMAVDGEFPATLDATKNAYQLLRLGVAETLTRITPQNQVVPWLAREVSAVAPSTWRVALRPNAKFWD